MRAVERLLLPVSPFDFDRSAAIFSDGDPQIRRYEGGTFWQVLRLDPPALARVRSAGTVDEPRVAVSLLSNERLGADEAARADATIGLLFNLDLDLAPFLEAVAGDPAMSALALRLRGLRSPTTETPHEALVRSIAEQQPSLAASHRIEDRLVRGSAIPCGSAARRTTRSRRRRRRRLRAWTGCGPVGPAGPRRATSATRRSPSPRARSTSRRSPRSTTSASCSRVSAGSEEWAPGRPS